LPDVTLDVKTTAEPQPDPITEGDVPAVTEPESLSLTSAIDSAEVDATIGDTVAAVIQCKDDDDVSLNAVHSSTGHDPPAEIDEQISALPDLQQRDIATLFTDQDVQPVGLFQEDWERLVNLDTPKSLTPAPTENHAPVMSTVQMELASIASVPKLLYTPVHMSTMLVEYWFSDVCGMWSAFDSSKNPNRQMAFSTWQQSQPVYYAMQCMSATCLVDSLPHVKEQVALLSAQAVNAIEQGVAEYLAPHNLLTGSVPTDLLLAIFAMGTSVCWADTRQLGIWFLGKAQEVLAHCEGKDLDMDPSQMRDLTHFREAMVYWEMLSRVVGW
jgi:hypothetical protein